VAEPENVRLAYLCLQPLVQGQASYAHVGEIVFGLRQRRFTVDVLAADSSLGVAGPAKRVAASLWLQCRLFGRLRHLDALYLRLHPLTLPAVAAARALRVASVVEINGTDSDVAEAWPWARRVSALIRAATRAQLRLADVAIVVTPELGEWVRTAAKRTGPIELVPNGANTELFDGTASRRQDRPGRYVVFFGALAAWQGVDAMLAAVQEPEWPPDVLLVFAGDGAERSKVERAASRSNLVDYVGVVPYREVPALVSNAVAGLSVQIPVADRGSTGVAPLKLFETLAAGRPAIASDLPGQADLVRAGACGLVVPPDDPRALAIAVGRLAADPALADELGARGAALVRRSHSWEARAAQTGAIIEATVRKRARR
jgi:glycosyltransferase involved in cell wall biosynthesis